ncbi:MAG: septal ring lytic transglycosylase RlpA family protein [Treponema sp.]|nr:septal ring lytic transglycosylase RlpA family protein [Treponema sp.]
MMKNFILIVLFVLVIVPFQLLAQESEIFRQTGIASWYGREFEGRPTASGEIFDASQLTAAHPNLPFGTVLVVTNQHNNRSVTVRINDRGPFVPARIIDVSRAAAEQLDMIVTGTAPVTIESVDRIVLSPPVIGAQVIPQVRATEVDVHAEDALVAPAAAPAPLFTSQPVIIQPPSQFRFIPSINIVPEKSYRIQVGSYSVARNAVTTFDRLKNAGLNPAYERHVDSSSVEFYRVVLAGIRGIDVQTTAEKLSAAGFREAIIREEN